MFCFHSRRGLYSPHPEHRQSDGRRENRVWHVVVPATPFHRASAGARDSERSTLSQNTDATLGFGPLAPFQFSRSVDKVFPKKPCRL